MAAQNVRSEAAMQAIPQPVTSGKTATAYAGSPCILGTGTALPRHHYSQQELAEVAQKVLPELGVDPKVIQRFFMSVGVKERYLALPAAAYARSRDRGSRDDGSRADDTPKGAAVSLPRRPTTATLARLGRDHARALAACSASTRALRSQARRVAALLGMPCPAWAAVVPPLLPMPRVPRVPAAPLDSHAAHDRSELRGDLRRSARLRFDCREACRGASSPVPPWARFRHPRKAALR